jgi:hypothetical protein
MVYDKENRLILCTKKCGGTDQIDVAPNIDVEVSHANVNDATSL